jgi:hypothetical protein
MRYYSSFFELNSIIFKFMEKKRKNSIVLEKSSMNSKNLKKTLSEFYTRQEEYMRVEKAYLR